MSPELLRRLEACYSGILHDVMRAKGQRDFVLPSSIVSLVSGEQLCGPVFTMEGGPVAADPHETLLAWTGFLSRAPSGHVVVCQANDSDLAHMGELSAETLKSRGVRGYVVDGGCRDVDFVLKIGFPVWCRYATPRDVVGAWLPRSFGEDIRIGAVTIATGDILFADRDGVVVIPAADFESVLEAAEVSMQTENEIRRAILDGMDPQDAYLRYGKF